MNLLHLDQLFEAAKHYTEYMLKIRKPVPPDNLRLPPAFFLKDFDGNFRLYVWQNDFGDEASKNRFVTLARALAVGYAASASCFALETWISTRKGIMPRDDPNRQDAIVLMGESAGVHRMRTLPIAADKKTAQFIAFQNMEQSPDQVKVSGRFCNVCPISVPSEHHRRIALTMIEMLGIKIEIIPPK